MAYDVLIKGGRIVDGTGKAALRVTWPSKGIGSLQWVRSTDPPERTIDAAGHVVAPGFIDAHTHYDAQLLWDPTANPSTAHGITTILTGNCGYTLAPVRRDDQDYLMGLFAAAEEIPKGALQLFAPFPWETFPDFLDSMEGQRRSQRRRAGRAQCGASVRDGRRRARAGGDARRGGQDGGHRRGGDRRRRRRTQQQPGPAPAGRARRAHSVILRRRSRDARTGRGGDAGRAPGCCRSTRPPNATA